MPDSVVRIPPSHALCVYAEPIASGRRVVIVGDCTLGFGERMLALGARMVHMYDPDGARANASRPGARGLTVLPLPESDFNVRDGAFDVAIVPDIGALPDSSSILARLRKVVGPGVALIAMPIHDGKSPLDYYAFFDLVALQFAHVRMLGQVPFIGVALAELGVEAPQISVDTQLVQRPSSPECFIAVASQTRLDRESFSIIQFPGDAFHKPDPAVEEVIKKVPVLEEALADTSTKLKREESRAGDNHVRAERLTHDIRKLEEELQRQRDRGFRLTRDVEEEKKARQKAELELGMIRKSPELAAARARITQLEEAVRGAEAVSAESEELGRLEAALQERAHEVKALERELARREALVQELVGELEEARSDTGDAKAADLAEMGKKLDRMALELAQREASLQTSRWAIAELEQAKLEGRKL